MSFIPVFSALTWIEPVGWMLLHSVWLIGLIAMGYALVDSVLRSRSANVRYLLGCAALTLSILALPVAFWLAPADDTLPSTDVANNSPREAPVSASPQFVSDAQKTAIEAVNKVAAPLPSVVSTPLVVLPLTANRESPELEGIPHEPKSSTIESAAGALARWRQLTTALRPWLAALVSGWILGVLLLSLRPLLGWLGVRRLRQVGLSDVPVAVSDTVRSLSGRLGIARVVCVVQSALVEVPCVIGAWRPMILLPASVLTGLSPEQLQAVLAHELAHIRRHDFVINVLQSAIETLLFYHPAVWWLSHRIRQERENCCDDIAIGLCGDTADYARMLISIEALRGQTWQPSVAATGGSLVQRIRRLQSKSHAANRSPWPLVAVVVVLIIGLTGIGYRSAALAQGKDPAPNIKQDRGDNQPARLVDPPKKRNELKVVKDPADSGIAPERWRIDPPDHEAERLRELGQKFFKLAGYESMAATYGELCARPSSTVEDHLWRGHAYQLQRNWPAACEAYRSALQKLDAQIAFTATELKELDAVAKGNESIKIMKGSKYPFLKRAQEQLPKEWATLVLYVGMLELTELKSPEAAAKTLSQGLRFDPELAVPLDKLLVAAEAVVTKKADPPTGLQSNATIVPVETLRYLAMAQEQLQQPAEALDTWVRVRLCQMAYQSYYATTDPAHLKELAGKLPEAALQSPHHFALEHPQAEGPKTREAKDFLKSGAANPFTAVPLPGFDFMQYAAAANLAKLRDGRWIMAYVTGDHHQSRIKLSMSKDGAEWDAPWEFAHNSIFNTRAPSLLVADDGEIWMLCVSQRLTTQRFASAPYQLWLTHSRDGREWSTLRPLQMKAESERPEIAVAQYQELPQLMRLPGSRVGIIWQNQFATAQSPSELTSLKSLPLPIEGDKPYVCNTHITFESNGRCHLVFDDFGRALYYTRSDDMQTWSPLQSLGKAEKDSSISKPQLLIEGDQVALIHERGSGSWLLRGIITEAGLKLGPATQIADHMQPLNGSSLTVDGDQVRIFTGGRPYVPNLLTAPFAAVLESK